MTRSLARALAIAGLVALASCRAAPPKDARVVTVDEAKGAPPGPAKPPCLDVSAPPLEDDEAYGLTIEAICVEGASPSAREAIEAKLGLRPGSPLTEEGLRDALARAHATGAAADVAAYGRRVGGRVALFVVIRERPRVGAVTVEGAAATSITVKQAPGPTGLHAGEYYDPAYAHERAAELRSLYVAAGFEEAAVAPEVVPRGDVVDVRMVIVEGPRSRLGPITFRGARKAFEAAALAASGLVRGEPVDPDKLELAPAKVSAFYFDRGFVDVRVTSRRGERDKDGAVPVTFEVVEGDVFTVGAIRLAKHGLDEPAAKAIVAKLKTRPGRVFRRSELVSDIELATKAFADRGRRVKIEPLTELARKKKTVDVDLEVTDVP